jgi:hypothetical protein
MVWGLFRDREEMDERVSESVQHVGYLSTQRDRALRLQCRHAAKRSHHSFEWFMHAGASGLSRAYR